MKHILRWLKNVLIALDQLGNAILLGDPDETISSRLGKCSRASGGKNKFCYWSCMILSWIDPRPGCHCLDAIEDDEGKDAC